MRAAVIRRKGAAPTLKAAPDPVGRRGHTLIQVLAAALNPLDIALANGTHYLADDRNSYIPGVEGAGFVLESDIYERGELVYAGLEGMGIIADGTFAERAIARDSGCVPLPNDFDPKLAAGLGIAGITGFLSVAWRGRMVAGERVLVLGATGATGSIALQTARLHKPRWLVAVGRDGERLTQAKEHGAHVTVRLGETDDLAEQLRSAFGGAKRGPSLIIDMLWGSPLSAALKVAEPGARVVQVGQAAGPKFTMNGADLRGKALEMLGFSIFHVPKATRREAFLRLVRFARLGDIDLPVRPFPLTDVADAWRLQKEGPGAKLVVCP